MRASEFITENSKGKISNRQQSASRGLHTFHDTTWSNSDYVLNRVMMAVAGTDGKTPIDMDMTSWVGKERTAQPYTEEEANMLKLAYKAAGATWSDVNQGNMESEELKNTNTLSPITSFKGYKRK
jgi:hypothetical protein